MKLYWRIKKNGKWTWTPAIYDLHTAETIMTEVVHPDAELVTLWWPSKGNKFRIGISDRQLQIERTRS